VISINQHNNSKWSHSIVFHSRLFFTVIILTLFNACSSGASLKRPKGAPIYYPYSLQSRFVESSNSNETLLRSTGKGLSVGAAIEDAKKAGGWYILYGGDRSLLKKPLYKNGKADVEGDFFESVEMFIRYESPLKSKRIIDDIVYVELIIKYDVGAMRRYLEENSVIQSQKTLTSEFGKPTIGVLSIDNTEISRVSATAINEYLIDRGFEVFDLSNEKVKDETINKLSEFEGIIDPTFATALESATDVTIKVGASVRDSSESTVNTSQAAVEAVAMYTASGKTIAASTGQSPSRLQGQSNLMVIEASHDVGDKLTLQILKSWSRQKDTGRAFKVILMSGVKEIDYAFYDHLRKISYRNSDVKRVGSGQGLSSYIVFLSPHRYKNGYDVFRHLQKVWVNESPLELVKDSGALIILKAGETSGISL
jgi:hypothetical protein